MFSARSTPFSARRTPTSARPARAATLCWLLLTLVASAGCDADRSIDPNSGQPAGGQPPGAQPPGGQPPGTQPPPPPPSDEAPGLDPTIFPALGTSTFMTANENEQLSNGTHSGNTANGRGALDDDADFAAADGAGAGEAAPGAAPPQAPAPEAVPDITREIVEADVFELDGDLLYVLNRYRGLVIIDVSDPDNLRLRGRLPFQAVPIEMYVRDGRAYILNSDYFVYWQYDPEADPHGFHGSQVMVADVEDPDAPSLLGSFPVEGEVTDSRMVGDVLYTVSKRRADYWRYNTADWEDRTWILSMDISDPQDIREIDRITFQGQSTLIHVAHHAIFVAGWDPNFVLTDPDHEQETLVTYVDISDPAGVLRERGKVYVPGHIIDRFKMDWFDGYFRVISQRWYSDEGITLHVVSTAHPDTLAIDTSLNLPDLRSSGLQATRFAGDRAVTFHADWSGNTTRRWLTTLDLSDPLAPQVAGRLSVDIDFNHVEVHGDRIIGIGRHYARNVNTQTAVALYDVSHLDNPALLSFQRLGEGHSNSEANVDDKAFKTFPDLGLALVPLNFWTNNRSFQGMQIIEWANDRLVERGRTANTGGVRRAFPVGDPDHHRLMAVGEMVVSVIDATDLDRPLVTEKLELVRYAHDLFDVQGKQVQLMTDPFARDGQGEVRLEIRAFGPDDDTPPLATLSLPYSYVPYALRDGDTLHLIGYEQDRGQVVRTADLSDLLHPRLRGELRLDDAATFVFQPGGGFYTHYWNPYAGLPLRNQLLPMTFRTIVESASGRRDWESELRFLDLRDPDDPRVADGAVPMNDFPFVNKMTHGEVLYSTHVEQATTEAGESLLYHVRAYVDRVDVSDPDHPVALPSVNVPGYLVDVSDDGRLWYTVDFQWDDFGRRRNSLNVLRLVDDDPAEVRADLVTVIPVADQIHRAAMRPGYLGDDGGRPVGWHDRTLWLTAHKYPWWGVRSDTVSSRQPYTVIRRIDLGETGDIVAEQRNALAGYHFDLLDVDGSRLYLGSRFPTGLLVVDVANLAANGGAPLIENAARTIGYLSRIVVNAGHVYAPMGAFGVHRY